MPFSAAMASDKDDSGVQMDGLDILAQAVMVLEEYAAEQIVRNTETEAAMETAMETDTMELVEPSKSEEPTKPTELIKSAAKPSKVTKAKGLTKAKNRPKPSKTTDPQTAAGPLEGAEAQGDLTESPKMILRPRRRRGQPVFHNGFLISSEQACLEILNPALQLLLQHSLLDGVVGKASLLRPLPPEYFMESVERHRQSHPDGYSKMSPGDVCDTICEASQSLPVMHASAVGNVRERDRLQWKGDIGGKCGIFGKMG